MESKPSSLFPRLFIFTLVIAVLGSAVLVITAYIGRLGEPLPTREAEANQRDLSPSPTIFVSPQPRSTAPSIPETFTPEISVQSEVISGGNENPAGSAMEATDLSIIETSTRNPLLLVIPTALPLQQPTLAAEVIETIDGSSEGELQSVEIPTPVPTFEIPESTTNILLLGSDTPLNDGAGRTDTMIIVSVDKSGPTASMVSLPRDLYVYIPGWKMNRLNTALAHGSSIGYPGGPIAQLTDTILYNFGVPIHFYAQIDFLGFKQAVDLMGGIEVAVSCQLEDWRLTSPELDPNEEENWSKFSLEPGVHLMNGDLALWYVRSRRSTSDFDRGRRQQQLLRAMLIQGVDLGLISSLPEFWQTYQDTVETNMDVGRIFQLAAMAPGVRENGVQHLYIVGDELEPFVVPETNAQVQIPVWEEMEDTFHRLFLPPALNRATRPPIKVEIVNASGNQDLAVLAADNLSWYGFEPVIGTWDGQSQGTTSIRYYGQHFKGSFDWLLSWIFDRDEEEIELVTDVDYPTNYRVILGRDYDPCRPQLFAPQIYLDQQ